MYDRTKTIGASDAVHIHAGNWAELYDRKQSKGPPEFILAAEIGKELEAFNIRQFVRQTGSQVHIDPEWQENPITHSLDTWCKFLPDALTYDLADIENALAEPKIPVEAKCVNFMWNHDNLLNKYMPQLQHAMRIMGAPYCWFSVLYLNTEYEIKKIEYDWIYDNDLHEMEELFMWYLLKGKRPPYKKRRKWYED